MNRAIMMDGTNFEGRQLKINKPKPKVNNHQNGEYENGEKTQDGGEIRAQDRGYENRGRNTHENGERKTNGPQRSRGNVDFMDEDWLFIEKRL